MVGEPVEAQRQRSLTNFQVPSLKLIPLARIVPLANSAMMPPGYRVDCARW